MHQDLPHYKKKMQQRAKPTVSSGCRAKGRHIRDAPTIPREKSPRGQHKHPPCRTPLQVVLRQPCSFTCLPYWLQSPGKTFSPTGSILHKLFSLPYFCSLLMLCQQSEVHAEAKPRLGAGNMATSQAWVTHHIHLDTEVSVLCAWTGGNSITSGAGRGLSLLLTRAPARAAPSLRQVTLKEG